MKCLKRLFLVSTFFVVSSQAQTMRTLGDVQKLKEQEARFVNKPLKTLLKEIGPQIRSASAQSNRPDNMPSYIIFKFVDGKEYLKHTTDKQQATIIVYIKENFKWDISKLNNFAWAKADEEKYGNLTVLRIGVIKED